MARMMLDVGVDLATTRLIKLAQGLRLSEALPTASGRKLEQLAKSVRLFAEANEHGAAADVLDEMAGMLSSGGDELANVRGAVERGVTAVRRCLGVVGVQRARQDRQFRGPVEAA